MIGWFKHHRNLFERPWAKDPKTVVVYEYLHCHAYLNDGMLNGRLVRRGSCPTSRAAIMEGTGLSEDVVKSRLRKLLEYGEIIVNTSNLGSIITLCDYESYYEPEDIFAFNTSNETPNKVTSQLPSQLPTYIDNKNIDNKNNLISPYSPYKNERENKDVALEVKKRYNKEFAGMLPPCIRLSTSTRIAVEECLRRFGLQSVDMVFAQIKTEKFHLGDNKTGFIANFTFIFTPKNYQQYIERAQLARQKKEAQQTKVVAPAIQEEPQLTKAEKDAKRDADRRNTLVSLVETIKTIDHKPVWYDILLSAYESGELAGYGIDWKPNNND